MKKLMSVLLAVAMCLSLAVPAFAAEEGVTSQNISLEECKYYISYDKNGKIVDCNMPRSLLSPQAEDHTYLSSTWLSSGIETDVNLGEHPHTQIWRKVSSYAFSESNTVSISLEITYKGRRLEGTLGISGSASSSFSFTRDADPNRYSKIQVICDYSYNVYRGDVCDEYTHEVLYSFEYVTFEKIAEDPMVIYRDEVEGQQSYEIGTLCD